MAETGGIAANLPAINDNHPLARHGFGWDDALSFLAAGSILFASLVIGSLASLMLAGSNHLIAAILHGFLGFGLWTLGGFLAAFAATLAVTGVYRRVLRG